MKQVIFIGTLVSCLALPAAMGQDPAPAAEQQTSFVVARITEFNGAATFSVMSPAEIITLKKSIPSLNEAARKAFSKVRRAWQEKYKAIEEQYQKERQNQQNQQIQQNQQKQVQAQKPGAVVIDLRPVMVQQDANRPKEPPFPVRALPVKEVRELETCATESQARERISFYEAKEAELKRKAAMGDPLASPAFGAGTTSAFGSVKGGPKTAAPKHVVVDEKARDEVMKQFDEELKKILSGAPDETQKTDKSGIRKKEGLGTGTGNTFKGSTFGAKK